MYIECVSFSSALMQITDCCGQYLCLALNNRRNIKSHGRQGTGRVRKKRVHVHVGAVQKEVTGLCIVSY